MSVILITHDIGLVAQMAYRVLVMYAGQVVEQGDVHELFHIPAHPYTRLLLQTVPSTKDPAGRVLASIPGVVPEQYHKITGCRFAERCPQAGTLCAQAQPLYPVSASHAARCILCKPKGGEPNV